MYPSNGCFVNVRCVLVSEGGYVDDCVNTGRRGAFWSIRMFDVAVYLSRIILKEDIRVRHGIVVERSFETLSRRAIEVSFMFRD